MIPVPCLTSGREKEKTVDNIYMDWFDQSHQLGKATKVSFDCQLKSTQKSFGFISGALDRNLFMTLV